MNIVFDWFRRQVANQQVVVLVVLIALTATAIVVFGSYLAPVLASLVIAYFLDGGVTFLERRGMPRTLAMIIIFLSFLAALLVILLGLVPLVARQVTRAFEELPNMITKVNEGLRQLPDQFPKLFADNEELEVAFQEALTQTLGSIRDQITAASGAIGKEILAFSLSSFRGLIVAFVYLILMPTLVFFMLKDKRLIQSWFRRFLPTETGLADQVWGDVDRQIGNYIRGKLWEVLIVGGVTFFVFSLLGLQFSILLGVIVGLSVIVPYVGATVVTFPVAIIAYAQFGFSSEFGWLMVAYAIIQALDGNVLVPFLFSEVVSLHPIAIISAILIFGGFWGLWGVFFAIPLATLVQAVLKAWPRKKPPETRKEPPAPQAA